MGNRDDGRRTDGRGAGGNSEGKDHSTGSFGPLRGHFGKAALNTLLMVALALVLFVMCGDGEDRPDGLTSLLFPGQPAAQDGAPLEAGELAEDGEYSSRDEVALYLHTYGHLPGNFLTKREAQALGWEGGGLADFAPGKSIGGDHFGNYQSRLPEAPGREYHECDIGTRDKDSRGAKRLVYSNDGLIYYTEDHYETFTLLYGEE